MHVYCKEFVDSADTLRAQFEGFFYDLRLHSCHVAKSGSECFFSPVTIVRLKYYLHFVSFEAAAMDVICHYLSWCQYALSLTVGSTATTLNFLVV